MPTKRSLALVAVRGRYVTWCDDDDWQHPNRLDGIARWLVTGAEVGGSATSFFVDLHTLGTCHDSGRGRILFNADGFAAETAPAVRFDEGVRKASD